MKKRNLFSVVMLLFATMVFAQQESQYTQYMYNTMMFNPGYTGSRGVDSFFGIFRAQWIGLDGAPRSGGISYHAPQERLRNVGLGYSLFYDAIGPQTNTSFMLDFSYTLNFDNSKLAFGLKGTAEIFSLDYNKLRLYDPSDTHFSEN
ncbi:PorP/SprF family type IX secretion system membrane protein, partial [Capnocytophaga canis]